jgi:hypothetical protein
MQKPHSMRRTRRKAPVCPSLFDWERSVELLNLPAVRTVARRARVSPALASVIVELSGLIREAR